MLSLFHQLLSKERYLSAIELLEQLAEENPGLLLYQEKLEEICSFVCHLPELRGECAYHSTDDLQAVKNLLHRVPITPASAGSPVDFSDRQEALTRLRSAPLVCGSMDRVDSSGCMAEGGWRLTEHNFRNNPDFPLVSVVTICLNAESSISRAISSVSAQSYPNVEYIVVDGGSTDETVNILRNKVEHIAYFASQKDAGIYAAMNKGLKLARGEYIAILNADDYLEAEFLGRSLRTIEETGADISFCDYETENGVVRVLYPTEGILFSQLNIKHNTFLCHRKCFEDLGGFDETNGVVSDARWNRAAFLSNLKFAKTPGVLVFYSTQGASSAQSEAQRDAIIDESGKLIRLCFPFLDREEAKGIYRSNFNQHYVKNMTEILARNRHRPLFCNALREFLQFNLVHRPAFRLPLNNTEGAIRLISLVRALDLPLTLIQSGDENCRILRTLGQIDRVVSSVRTETGKVVLHFARNFSSPTETFIHELISDLDEREDDRSHVMLCDQRMLEEERRYDHVIEIPWFKLPDRIRTYFYKILWDELSPELVVAHFALNGFWLYQRLTHEQRSTPQMYMCHGIDVFSVARGGDYSEFVRTTAALSSNIVLTAVSEYLRQQLVNLGVPDWKVHSVPNSVSDEFFKHRKSGSDYRGNRPLEVITIGRLVGWKGHRFLLHALHQLKEQDGVEATLTIVYGGADDELESLQELARRLLLSSSINWIPFVDLAADPGYLTRFDIFALPSTYAEENSKQTETFGVSLLEAVAAGLPVVGTDAGGIPEVIGTEGNFARIAKNGSAESLRAALSGLLEEPEVTFSDNLEYARERLEFFSTDQRYMRWKNAENSLHQRRLKIMHFCALGKGGAAGASLNIHKALLRRGLHSQFVTREQERSRLPKFIPNVSFISPDCSFDFQQAQQSNPKPGHTVFSIDDHAVSNHRLLDLVKGADLVNLTWYAQFLSTENIMFLSQSEIPLMITVRDMYSLTGGCHYFHGCQQWQEQCQRCPQISDLGDNYPALVQKAKFESWNWSNINYAVLSEHSLGVFRRSNVGKKCSVYKLPNYVDTEQFHLEPVCNRMEILPGISESKFVVGYLPSFDSEVKGHDLFLECLKVFSLRHSNCEITVAWVGDGETPNEVGGIEIVPVPSMDSKNVLRAFYNCVDIVAVPSTEETFSNTTVEALACGSPVVGFATGVLAEINREVDVARVVPIGDTDGLADAIAWFYGRDIDSRACSNFIEENFNRKVCMENYLAAIDDIIARKRIASRESELTKMQSALADLREASAARKANGARARLRALRRKQSALPHV